MTKAIEKLERDVLIMSAMADEMEAYINSDVLFWHMAASSRMPTLTLGGYLMRQHRLLIMEHLLDNSNQTKIKNAVETFNNVLVEKIVRFERKAHRELEARLRQWGEYLKDIDRGTAPKKSNYSTAVETRVMLTAISEPLQLAPYKLEQHIPSQIALLDTHLRQIWKAGDFVWFEEWQTAYPKEDYWWLYGSPEIS